MQKKTFENLKFLENDLNILKNLSKIKLLKLLLKNSTLTLRIKSIGKNSVNFTSIKKIKFWICIMIAQEQTVKPNATGRMPLKSNEVENGVLQDGRYI
jgi:hypothetical protein